MIRNILKIHANELSSIIAELDKKDKELAQLKTEAEGLFRSLVITRRKLFPEMQDPKSLIADLFPISAKLVNENYRSI